MTLIFYLVVFDYHLFVNEDYEPHSRFARL